MEIKEIKNLSSDERLDVIMLLLDYITDTFVDYEDLNVSDSSKKVSAYIISKFRDFYSGKQ